MFHAAALKHVDLLERDWAEGVKTNVFGSVNVADAAVASGAAAMVMISTDKAIEAVSVLGATKRFAELYCQSLDANLARHAAADKAPMRLIVVRFGNVLASQRLGCAEVQGADRGRWAGDGHASRHGALFHDHSRSLRTGHHRVQSRDRRRSDYSVYVLNMGQPVKIVDLAERMIRLSGLEPGSDIEIVFTGKRRANGCRRFLFSPEEPVFNIGIEGIVAVRPHGHRLEAMRGWLAALDRGRLREKIVRRPSRRPARCRARFPRRSA